MNRIAVLLLILAATGCEARPRPEISKVITEKVVATELRMSFDPFDSNNSLRSRSESVYYLLAEDGTVLKVNLKRYAATKVGQSVSSPDWE